jgi:predicted nuclease of predicted toxin-antitoxin system
MKLLFDHHLSRKLVARVADLFPESSHVVLHGLDQASDLEVWTFARANGYTIVTRDNDFNDLSTLLGAPPKIIWLRIGNSTTARVEQVLRTHATLIVTFINHPTDVILEII